MCLLGASVTGIGNRTLPRTGLSIALDHTTAATLGDSHEVYVHTSRMTPMSVRLLPMP